MRTEHQAGQVGHTGKNLHERRRGAVITAVVLAAVAMAIYAWAIVSRM